jgi:maltose alpha-D-glucosyltransferase / alpha-amylase
MMLESDPLWYKDAIVYELHVRAFKDSVGDGRGDFRGLREKLDYLQDLGITAVWLLPFYPSPLKDDGYDIADYADVHPHYGSLRDFKEFLDAAHERGIRVITELVINHTSDQHPWFQRARRAPRGSAERDFYVWSDDPNKYPEARIIFKDFERSNWTWDPLAQQYYWHRFYAHQPDLNFDNPAVCDALIPILDFWLGLGVDGMRLDAIPYLYEREGTNCENLPETHLFLKRLRKHLDVKFPGRMFLAEANQWPEDAIAYFGEGDECHMAFHFPVMPRLFMALHMEDRFPILDILEQTPPIPDNCQWGMFLRNHDELTLEMVTDEERDYMYRAYAADPQARINLGIRRRLAPLLGNDRRRIELMNALLLSLPGTPVIYYGDEIGMGDNIYVGDRNGVRTPMQWSGDRNAGFSRANPQKLYLPVIIDPEYHYEAINVDAQQGNPSSLLWWMKRLIALRKEYKAFGRGTFEVVRPTNPKIFAFLRRYGEELILVAANLSRFVQYVEMDLREFQGRVPHELFGRTAFPPIRDTPYPLTLGPHSFYWLSLSPAPVRRGRGGDLSHGAPLPAVSVRGSWDELFAAAGRDNLEALLLGHLITAEPDGLRRVVTNVHVRQVTGLPDIEPPTYLVLVEVEFADESAELRAIPLSFHAGDSGEQLPGGSRPIGKVRRQGALLGLVADARTDPALGAAFLHAIAGGQRLVVGDGEIVGTAHPEFNGEQLPAPSAVRRGEQNNIAVLFDERFFLRLYHRIDEGINPDLEVGRFLTHRARYPAIAPVLGVVEYQTRAAEPLTLALLNGYVSNEGDAWQHTLDALSRFYEAALAARTLPPASPEVSLAGADFEPPNGTRALIEPYLRTAEQIGRQTAALHTALASHADEPAFAPEPFSRLYQRSLYQSMRNRTGLVFREVANRLDTLPEPIRDSARRVLELEPEIRNRFRQVMEHRIDGKRIRCHGDYHLGHLLYTGTDFVVIDFQGSPRRSLSERRLKRSPLRDVSSLVRSLHYAAFGPLLGAESDRGVLPGHIRDEDRPVLERWAWFWYSQAANRFVSAYYQAIREANLLPSNPEVCQVLLDAFLLEKAIQELGGELEYRPDWVPVPLRGILDLMGVI